MSQQESPEIDPQAESIQIETSGDIVESFESKETEKKPNCHSILEFFSARFLIQVVFQTGFFDIKTCGGSVSGKITREMSLTHEFPNVGFHIKYAKVPKIGYIPLQKLDIVMYDFFQVPILKFRLKNAMIHLDNGSSVLEVLRSRDKCSFWYRNSHDGISAMFQCIKFANNSFAYNIAKYFGADETVIRGRSRNRHGVRHTDANISDEGIEIYRSIRSRENLPGQMFIEKSQPEKTSKQFSFKRKTRRQFPMGTFKMHSNSKQRKPQTVSFLFTTGEEVNDGIRPFVCPISGHLGFSVMVGSTRRRFSSFGKFIKTLLKWTLPCHSKSRFKLFRNSSSPEIRFFFNYHPDIPGKGEIKIKFWDARGILRTEYSCNLEHLYGVFLLKAKTSMDTNFQNHKEWAERYHCPHDDACPRNCAYYIPENSGNNKLKKRIPIPGSIPCKCVGGSTIVSKYHYALEINKPIPIQMGGFFKCMLHDYQENPEMYKESSMKFLLDGHHELLYYIETFLFGFNLNS